MSTKRETHSEPGIETMTTSTRLNDQIHRKAYDADAVAPLRGVRVLDMSRLVAGNMVTHVLSDFGAEVIKIEDPRRHDDLRNWRVEGIPTFWKVYARNKKSITLNCRAHHANGPQQQHDGRYQMHGDKVQAEAPSGGRRAAKHDVHMNHQLATAQMRTPP